jgi:hypothetical protein
MVKIVILIQCILSHSHITRGVHLEWTCLRSLSGTFGKFQLKQSSMGLNVVIRDNMIFFYGNLSYTVFDKKKSEL